MLLYKEKKMLPMDTYTGELTKQLLLLSPQVRYTLWDLNKFTFKMLLVDLFYRLRQNSYLTRQLYWNISCITYKNRFSSSCKALNPSATWVKKVTCILFHFGFVPVLYNMLTSLSLPVHIPKEDKIAIHHPQKCQFGRLSNIWLSVFLETGNCWKALVEQQFWSGFENKPSSLTSRIRVFIIWTQLPKTRRLRILGL